MKNIVSFFVLCGIFFLLAGCQTLGREKEPDLQPVPPDINTAAGDENVPYTIKYAPSKLPVPEPPAVPPEMQAAMATPSRPGVTPPVKGPSGKYLLRSVLVVGDSFAVGIGMSLSGILKHYENIALYEQGKTSSGLNSKRFYNWEQKLREYLENKHPDALVIMISGNDAHNGSGSAAWARSYEKKMLGFLSIAEPYDVPVFLVGLPPMGKEDYSERAKVANKAIKNACRQSGDCEYIDAWPLFADDTGAFTRRKHINGQSKVLRGKDGVHFTMTGYRLLGNEILDHVGQRFELIRRRRATRQEHSGKKSEKLPKTASAP